MATYFTDEGICLRVTDFSETSQIVGMFTRTHGLVPLIAKGAKRPSKKNVMSGPLDLLTSGQVVFVPPKDTPGGSAGGGGGGVQLGTLAAWELADHRRALRTNLPALHAAMMCAEITTHLVHPLDPHPELFTELDAALDLLGKTAPATGNVVRPSSTGNESSLRPAVVVAQPPPAVNARVLVAYVKAALSAAGYFPQLQHCLACGTPTADAPMRFSPHAGGVFCARENGRGDTGGPGDPGAPGRRRGEGRCQASTSGLIIVVPGKVCLALDLLPLPAALRANPPDRPADPAALSLALQLLLAQVEAITDKPLRTRPLLAAIFEGNAQRQT